MIEFYPEHYLRFPISQILPISPISSIKKIRFSNYAHKQCYEKYKQYVRIFSDNKKQYVDHIPIDTNYFDTTSENILC